MQQRRGIIAWLTAALLALAVAGCATGRVAPDTEDAHPALWRVHGKAGTVYLFGSMHVLSPKLKWRDARVEAAIAEADAFWFESPLDGEAMRAYTAAHRSLPQGKTLRGMLAPDARQKLSDALDSFGLSVRQVDKFRPWYVLEILLTLQLQRMGFAHDAGVDRLLMAEARTRGKPLRYFETLEQQLALIAPPDPKVEMEFFEAFLNDFRDGFADLGPQSAAWARGDESKLAELLERDMVTSTGLRERMVDDRNAAWLPVLKRLLDDGRGTAMVVVGAGHLVGPRGLPATLRAAGYAVERL